MLWCGIYRRLVLVLLLFPALIRFERPAVSAGLGNFSQKLKVCKLILTLFGANTSELAIPAPDSAPPTSLYWPTSASIYLRVERREVAGYLGTLPSLFQARAGLHAHLQLSREPPPARRSHSRLFELLPGPTSYAHHAHSIPHLTPRSTYFRNQSSLLRQQCEHQDRRQ